MEDEMAKARQRRDAAMAAKAAEGSTQDGVFEAGIRAALQHSIDNMEPHLSRLGEALEEELDAGSFLLGVQVAAFVQVGLDAIQVAKTPLGYGLLKDFMNKARINHKEQKRGS